MIGQNVRSDFRSGPKSRDVSIAARIRSLHLPSILSAQTSALIGGKTASKPLPQCTANVRFGSFADKLSPAEIHRCPLRSKSGQPQARLGYTSGARKKIYDTISEAATHASYVGFSLFMNDQNLGEVGPFYNERKLSVWLGELVTRLSHAAVILASDAEGQDIKLLAARAHYLNVVNAWKAKYFPQK